MYIVESVIHRTFISAGCAVNIIPMIAMLTVIQNSRLLLGLQINNIMLTSIVGAIWYCGGSHSLQINSHHDSCNNLDGIHSS